MADDIWAGLLVEDTPVMPQSGLDTSTEEDGPERILARLEQHAGTKLTGSAREAALRS